MIYRSPLMRWLLAVVGVLAGLTLTLGDPRKWAATPSLHWLQGSRIPLWVWGIGFFIYAALILTSRFRSVGFALGAALYAVFTISALATLGDGAPKNGAALAALIGSTGFHIYSIRTAFDVVSGEKARRGDR